MPEVPGQPSPQPQPGAQAQQGQPPFGSSPATQPTQNAGYKVAGIKMLGMALMVLENAVPLLGSSTPEQADALSTIQKLSKHVPPGTVTPTDIKNVIQSLMMKMQQGQQQMQAMQARQMQGGGQHPQQMPPGAQAAPQQAAMMQPRAA